MPQKLNYPKHRKSPIRHNVKTHIRKGRSVHSFIRGRGVKPKTLTYKTKVSKIGESVKLKSDKFILHPEETIKIIAYINKKFGKELEALSTSQRYGGYFTRYERERDMNNYITFDVDFSEISSVFMKPQWHKHLRIRIKKYYPKTKASIIRGKVVRFTTTEVKNVKMRKLSAEKIGELDKTLNEMIDIYKKEINKMSSDT